MAMYFHSSSQDDLPVVQPINGAGHQQNGKPMIILNVNDLTEILEVHRILESDSRPATDSLALRVLVGKQAFWLQITARAWRDMQWKDRSAPMLQDQPPDWYESPFPTTSERLKPEAISDDLEDALKNYYFISRLARNPLVYRLELDEYRHPEDQPHVADGMALRRALDQAIDIVANDDVKRDDGAHRWRLECYFHLRYREERLHKDIAIRLGYSSRHLHRLRKELLRELTRVMLKITK